MKIVSWNCAGAFRKKHEQLFDLGADVYCIQECESPEKHERAFDGLLKGRCIVWKGNDPKKDRGVAVIGRPGLELLRLEWPGDWLRDFLPVMIGVGGPIVVNVWACDPYIENFNEWLGKCEHLVDGRTILVGDFNSNKFWDGKHGVTCHSDAVTKLSELGLESAYHLVTGEQQGQESKPTFYLYRHEDRPYHLDYAFAAPNAVKSFSLADGDDWMRWSDHVPIVLELDEEGLPSQKEYSTYNGLSNGADIRQMVAGYARRKGIPQDDAAELLLGGETLEEWRLGIAWDKD